MLLSVCIITYNEEKFIGDCLRSVKDIADEIIVIDSFSTDRTKTICEEEGCLVYQYVWENDYALARNRAIEKATGDWILFLDADEELVSPQALKTIVAKSVPASVGGFIMERTDIYRHRDSGKTYHQPIGIVRLFRRLQTIRYRSPIHEEVNSSVYEAGLKLRVMNRSIIKHKVSASTDDFLAAKQKKYLDMLSAELMKDTSNAWAEYHFAKTQWFFDQIKDAMDRFLKVAIRNDVAKDLRVAAYANAAILNNQLGLREAHSFLMEAEKIISGTYLVRLIRGDIFYSEKKYFSALKQYVQVPVSLMANNEGAMIPGGVYLRPELRLYKIACCFYAMKRVSVAKFLFWIGNVIYPFDPINLYGLSRVHKEKGSEVKAVKGFEKCIRQEPDWKVPQKELLEINSPDYSRTHT